MKKDENSKVQIIKKIGDKSVDDLILEIITAKKQTLKELAEK